MDKLLENLQEAEKRIKKADHLLYVTFPLVQDKKLLINIAIEIQNAFKKCINSILQQEHSYRRIRLYNDPKINLKNFKEKCAKRYNINKEETDFISELFDIIKAHKKSPFEFIKNDKIVILSENSKPYQMTLEKTKKYLEVGKNILMKTKEGIEKNLR